MTGNRARVDARDKVMGAPLFAADRVPDGLAHAALATATIDRGRIAALDTARAEAVPGVRLVLTRLGEDELRTAGFLMAGGYAFQSFQPLTSDRIAYRGQPVALVVADDPVAATHAAELVEARYEAEPHTVRIDDPGATVVLQQEAIPLPFLADVVVGDADAELAKAEVRVEAVYEHPSQNSAPMELIGAVVQWRGDTLVVHEGTQNAASMPSWCASPWRIDAERVEVVSPYTGGGFGQKNSLQPHIGPLAIAARRLGRPVKLVLTRPQVFHQASFRPVSRHHISLGADASGRLLAAVHEADQQTSRHDLFPATFTEVTSRLYGVPAFRGRQRLVQTDVQTPGYMRAPFEHPGAWAMECAVDELAHAAGADPVELRLANDTTHDPVTGKPFSSRHVAECLQRGAELFGWAKRRPEPAQWIASDGSQVGWGVAIGAYPAASTPAVARAVAYPDGRFGVEVDGHEMGQGIRSAITLLVADLMGVPANRVTVGLGDTRVATQHLTAGSWGTSSALPAVHAAILKLRETLGGRRPTGAPVAVSASNEMPEPLQERARAGQVALAGPVWDDFVAYSFIAHFVEVRVDAGTRRIRVPRVVSVADCGRVASPVTAASQVRGGVVWGLGAALREGLEVDERYGGFVNATLEEYPVTVNADVARIDVEFIDRPDPLLNPVGVKGLGEVSMVGVAAAASNAIFHATGRRVRRLPITIADLL
jgi:xanthine dehydrogenase YagR molybdenum-binding subunit